jgi:hypothetical protein
MRLLALALACASQAARAEPTDDAFARFTACLQFEGAERMSCLDKLSRDLTIDSTPQPPPVPADDGAWVISETTSPVDYSPQIAAAKLLRATGKDEPSSFAIGCRAGRTELAVRTLGSWRPSGVGDLQVAYQINSQPAVNERWTAVADGRGAAFRGDVVKFLQSLPDGARFSIRVHDWQGAVHEAVFQLTGLHAVRQKIATACKWLPDERAPVGDVNQRRRLPAARLRQ